MCPAPVLGRGIRIKRKNSKRINKKPYLKLSEKSNVSKTVDLLYKTNAKTIILKYIFFWSRQ